MGTHVSFFQKRQTERKQGDDGRKRVISAEHSARGAAVRGPAVTSLSKHGLCVELIEALLGGPAAHVGLQRPVQSHEK